MHRNLRGGGAERHRLLQTPVGTRSPRIVGVDDQDARRVLGRARMTIAISRRLSHSDSTNVAPRVLAKAGLVRRGGNSWQPPGRSGLGPKLAASRRLQRRRVRTSRLNRRARVFVSSRWLSLAAVWRVCPRLGSYVDKMKPRMLRSATTSPSMNAALVLAERVRRPAMTKAASLSTACTFG